MPSETSDDRAGRVLVVIGSLGRFDALSSQLGRRIARDGGPAVHVVAPALTETALDHAAGNVDEAIEIAKRRLEQALRELRSTFGGVSGGVGDSDPLLAIGDALRTAEYDEIVIVTSEEDAWPEDEAFDRTRTEYGRPITHLELSSEGAITEVEHSPPGVDPPPAVEVDAPTATGSLGRITLRGLLGIVVAVVGTAVLIVLAANCLSGGSVGAACIARTLLAGGVGLINLAHVIGLTMFAGAGYHGPPERFFALTSLWGTPVAVAISLAVPA